VTRAVLGLGANLGDAVGAVRAAVAGLAAHPGVEVVAVSGLWRTTAVGGPEQPDYLNAVVLITSTMGPEDLLAMAQALERAAGREREVRWGPRTLDVDLLDVEGVRSNRPDLTLPHPRAHERAFVLAPWAQVDPGWVLEPVGGAPAPVRWWREAVADQEVTLLDDGSWWR
jgi:dihydroneopterin aldolase/2-amino-4-hydroxy-6-hydroxymethyldihydropteridine diphosphokinase